MISVTISNGPQHTLHQGAKFVSICNNDAEVSSGQHCLPKALKWQEHGIWRRYAQCHADTQREERNEARVSVTHQSENCQKQEVANQMFEGCHGKVWVTYGPTSRQGTTLRLQFPKHAARLFSAAWAQNLRILKGSEPDQFSTKLFWVWSWFTR